ncbi:MAG: DUF4388 domain-containing protein [Nitrospiria bacterium]
MALKGSIKEFGLSEIFQLIFHQTKEGVLTLTRDTERVDVLFKKGRVIRADEGDRSEHLKDNLMKAGLLTPDQIGIVAYREAHTESTLETILIELELLEEKQLMRLLRLFTEGTLYRLFHWKTGDYEFEQKVISYNPNLFEPIDPQFILMEAVRQVDEWPALLKKIPSRDMIFRSTLSSSMQTPDFEEDSQGTEEDPFGDLMDDAEEEGDPWLIQQIDGQRTVQEIIDLAQLGAFDVYQGIVNLLKEKKVEAIKSLDFEEVKDASVLKKETLVKGVIGFLSLCFTIGLFVVFYPSIQNTLVLSKMPSKEIKALTAENESYFIRFALDLYFLKYNRYPEDLSVLVEEGFFGQMERFFSKLDHWSYRLASKEGDEYRLSRIDPRNLN